ncbi:MAG: NADH-quinone oxidoreductase subunit E, partial [Pseudomonadota bacterium]
MFQNWGFLVGEIWALLALAALIGLVAGWLIWGGSRAGSVSAKEAQGLNEDLARLRKSDAQKDG